MKATLPDGTQLEGTPDELARFINRAPFTVTLPAFTIPYPCLHEYPNPWNSVSPPSCRKCGHVAPIPSPYVVATSGYITAADVQQQQAQGSTRSAACNHGADDVAELSCKQCRR